MVREELEVQFGLKSFKEVGGITESFFVSFDERSQVGAKVRSALFSGTKSRRPSWEKL